MNDVTDRLEEMRRAALAEELVKEGVSINHLNFVRWLVEHRHPEWPKAS